MFESVPTWVVLWGFNRFAIFPFENEKPVNYGNEYNFYLQSLGDNNGATQFKTLKFTWNNLTLTWYSSDTSYIQLNSGRVCYAIIF